MRRAAATDANHAEIAKALRKIGFSVLSLHQVGQGVPDLLVGAKIAGEPRNFLMELKRPDVPPSQRKLTPDEYAFHMAWRGQIAVVHSIDEALAEMGVLAR